jgi:hypothetical protein
MVPFREEIQRDERWIACVDLSRLMSRIARQRIFTGLRMKRPQVARNVAPSIGRTGQKRKQLRITGLSSSITFAPS